MEDISWKLHLASSPEAIWKLLATDAGRERFWCEASRRTGDTIEMRFSSGVIERATVLTERPPRLLTLRYFGAPAHFELEQDGHGGTDLQLCHQGVPEADRDEVRPGWLNVLLPLKAMADHGIDLRNHDPERSWDQGYCDG